MYSYYNKHKTEIETIVRKSPLKSENVILLVDNRQNEMSVLSCMFAMLNTNWECIIYTSKASTDYYKNKLPNITVLNHPLLEKKFDIDIYNDILEDYDVWNYLREQGYTKALIIQDDGIIVKKGISRFLQYDYVGAPWQDSPDNEYIKKYINVGLVGNGGLSLRSIDKMMLVCEKYKAFKHELFYHNINRIPEDVFFVKYLIKENCIIPQNNEASFFSCEQIINPSAIGFHKFWVYHNYDTVKAFFNNILQS
jgi:hypothetical protein